MGCRGGRRCPTVIPGLDCAVGRPSWRRWTGCSPRSGRAGAGCWCCGVRPGSARRRCWTTCAEQRVGLSHRARGRRRVRDGARVRRAASAVRADARPAASGCPAPQRDALRRGVRPERGRAPDRFLVGLAVLGLLAEAAEERPLLCLVDDAQWLDRASAQALAFVARRLLAERVGAGVRACGNRATSGAGGPAASWPSRGSRDADARALLASVDPGPLDERVRDRIVAETRGNPLALLELPRGLSAGGAGGRVRAARRARRWRAGSSRASARRLQSLPVETQRLLLLGGGRADRRRGAAVARRRAARASAPTRRRRPRRRG